jgi:MerR family transcriptional regulator, light-induced transcriptional regulator
MQKIIGSTNKMTNNLPSEELGTTAPHAGWTISDVERETGLGKDTLRVWERRYGFPQPLRSGTSERIYSHDQVQKLQLIKRLLDAGERPGKVVALDVLALQTLLSEKISTAPKSGKRGKSSHTLMQAAVEDLQEPWVQWLADDETLQIKQALQQKILRHGLGQVVGSTIAPLCQLIGEAWMKGEISVYQEHLFTEILQGVLREAITSIDGTMNLGSRSPRVLLTTTPNEMHGLGLLMAESHFALESCERYVLGTSTPLADTIEAVRRLRIDILALSFSAYASRNEVVDSLRLLRSQLDPNVEIWVGGAGAKACAKRLPEGVVLLLSSGAVSEHVKVWREDKQLQAI